MLNKVHPLFKALRRRYKRVLVVSLCLLAAAGLAWVWFYLRPDTWAYYTDELTFRQTAKYARPQLVVWENATLSPGDANIPSDMSEPAISPDGVRMVFTRGLADGNADLYMVTWDGLTWGEPQPLRALNSAFNEIGPAFSHDGQLLYFSTDRPGGLGGYDIWVARWDGAEFAWPMPLTLMVNSRFDDLGPAPSPGGDKLYFSSNRPRLPLTDEEAAFSDKALRERFKHLDHDIFEAHRIPAGVTNQEVERAMSMLYSLRTAALADTNVMAKLGGSVESERAVDKAMVWLAANQETNGVWSIAKSGGQAGHDVAATALALLTFAGRSELHDRPCTYRETVSRGLDWLLEQQNTITGDLRGSKPIRNGMYSHAIGALALAEIYGLTKDEDLRGPAQDAIDFLVDAQNVEDGGWRYQPNEPGDMSVSGWVIMALKSAEMSGLHVPGHTFDGVTRWLARVSGGTAGGIYKYTRGDNTTRPAMIATGYFCSQLMGLSPNTPTAFETTRQLARKDLSAGDIYYGYYAMLCAYQNQGPFWRQWNQALQHALPAAQEQDGSWAPSGAHGVAMGRTIATALSALSLQVHYRYTPLYGLGYEPATSGVLFSTANLADLPEMPIYRRARRMLVVNSPGHDVQPAVTGHGDFLYFASDRAGGLGGLDIYRSRISGEEPERPVNLGPAVNSKSDETGPTLRMGGFNLLFTSNRGQADDQQHQWYHSISRTVFRRGDSYTDDISIRIDSAGADVRLVLWEDPYPAVGSFSVATQRRAPQFLADGASMTFEHEIPGTTNSNVVVSRWDGRRWSDPIPYEAPTNAAEIVRLPFRNGSYVYSAAEEDGGLGGLDLYRARRLNGEDLPKENLGAHINSPGDDKSPLTRWEGFDLLFESNRGQDAPGQSLLYSSTAREVVERVDLSRWYRFSELVNRIKWWFLLALAAVVLLIYLLRHWRDLTSLFHKSLAASFMFHLLLALLMSIWFIRAELLDSIQPKTMEVAIDVDALAREKLALNMQEATAELPAADVSVAIERPDAVPMPEFTPPERQNAAPVPTQSSEASFVTKVTPSRASESDTPSPLAAAVARLPAAKMPALNLPVLEVVLEEPNPVEPDNPLEPSDAREIAVEFKPSDIQEDIVLERAKPRQAESKPLGRLLEDTVELTNNLARAVSTDTAAATRDTGGSLAIPSAGMESVGALPRMDGKGDIAALLIASPLRGKALKMNAPGKLDVPSSHGAQISPAILENPGRLSTEIIEALGGSSETQGSIARALDWFTKNQEPDGRWDIQKHGGQPGHDVAATSLALLCYYGWGAKHTEAGPYQKPVQKALDWLLNAMGKDKDGNPNGDYCTGHGINGMYDQGMAALALCEAYGLTKDKRLMEPAQKAVQFIVDAQNGQMGGWRYLPRSNNSDTSVFGWQYMALRSAELAGLSVPKESLALAGTWLDRMAGGTHGGIYGYDRPGDRSRPAMIATGMFSRQLARVQPGDPRMEESARFMKAHPINAKSVDWYYLYYGTLALYQHQGKIWEDWNGRMKETLTALQHKTGDLAGSWDPSGAHAASMGRAVTTALGTLSLEVYYRILPVYGFRPAAE